MGLDLLRVIGAGPRLVVAMLTASFVR